MADRQKILLGAFLAVLVIWQGGGSILGMLFSPWTERYRQIKELDQKLVVERAKQHQLELSDRKLRMWKQASLPPNASVASTLYHHWLLNLAQQQKLEKLEIHPGTQTQFGAGTAAFQRVSMKINASGTMEQISKFLYDFYRADLIQRVVHCSLQTDEYQGSPKFKLQLTVEGLSLNDAPARTTLFISEKASQQVAADMKSKSLDSYASLWKDNPFVRGYNGPVKPPPPPAPPVTPPPPPLPFDSSPHVYLVACLQVNGTPEAWLYDRTTNQNTVLYVNTEFEIAGKKGKVLAIDKRSIRIFSEKEELVLEAGKNLKEMESLTNPRPASITPPTTPPAPTVGGQPTAVSPTVSAKPTSTRKTEGSSEEPQQLPATKEVPVGVDVNVSEVADPMEIEGAVESDEEMMEEEEAVPAEGEDSPAIDSDE